MRSLIHLTLCKATTNDTDLQEWLINSNFRPHAINLSDSVRQDIISTEDIRVSTDQSGAIPKAQTRAIDLLSTIPLADLEREHAVNDARWAIECTNTTHNDAVPVMGVVSRATGSKVVAIRWKHTSTRSLEVASERLVQAAQEATIGLFVSPTGNVSIRETHKSVDAYHGDIVHSPDQLWKQARAEKSAEFWIAVIAFLVALVGSAVSVILYYKTDEGTLGRWLAGYIDRLATTALASAALSFLQVYFLYRHLKKQQRSIIWK